MRYELLQYQSQVLKSSVRTSQLGILQRDSTTRLKEKVEGKSILYHSTNQQDEQLRIIVFAFLVKIFTSYTPRNQDNLNKLKTMIYNSPLQPSITTHQGIEASQLFKCFAEKINNIQIKEYVDQQICTILNSSSFFEDVLFIPLQNMMGRKQYDCKHTRLSIIKDFMKKQFGITIKMPVYGFGEVQQGQNDLVLYSISNHLHKICKMEPKERRSSSSSISREIQNMHYSVSPIKEEESIKMDNSANISDFTPLSAPRKKQFHQPDSAEVQTTNFVTTSWEKKRNRREPEKAQKKGFFDMFCCCQ